MIMSIGLISAATSADGTSIGYRVIGRGPGLVMLHGAMESASSHSELAAEVSDSHTVYLPDRRGRGMSGPHRAKHDINTEVDDLAAVLAGTGATDVLGVSSGAVIALEASLRLPQLHRVAIFEPPLIVGDSLSTSFTARYREELGRGDLPSALVTGMKGSKMGPAIFEYIPRPLLRALTVAAMRRQERTLGPNEVSMRMLAPTLGYDFGLVEQARDRLDVYSGTPAEVLLLGGASSAAYLRTAMDAVSEALPTARRITFPKLGHGATGNARFGGRPDVVARTLREFFSA
jgi:pimeloyl-ACP methyl ester carboxylesterase